LKERGFILVGIDIIGDKMTEINVTSPTGCARSGNSADRMSPPCSGMRWNPNARTPDQRFLQRPLNQPRPQAFKP
jgi:hypothetical protein